MKGTSKDKPVGDSSTNKSSTSNKLSTAEADPKLQQPQTANNKSNDGKNHSYYMYMPIIKNPFTSLVINLSNISNQSMKLRFSNIIIFKTHIIYNKTHIIYFHLLCTVVKESNKKQSSKDGEKNKDKEQNKGEKDQAMLYTTWCQVLTY